MSNTKQTILNASLQLFNERGISNVSLRMIADEMGISVGNLQYHFKKREDIVEMLYFELVEKIDSIAVVEPHDLLKSLFAISTEMFLALYEYRFFLLDFVAITRRNQTIKTHYAEISHRRENEFIHISKVLIEHGLFREELIKNEYHNLYKRTEVITNFWFSSTLIQAENVSKDSIEHYSLLISQSIYPFLTEEGKRQYALIFPVQLV